MSYDEFIETMTDDEHGRAYGWELADVLTDMKANLVDALIHINKAIACGEAVIRPTDLSNKALHEAYLLQDAIIKVAGKYVTWVDAVVSICKEAE